MKRNAIIMAAGTSSRFLPISYEYPKAFLKVKGEILIERQISQLKEAGIQDITIIVGYKAEQFQYLEKKFDVQLVYNCDYSIYNNTSSLIRVLDKLKNTFICSSDNYFSQNVFIEQTDFSYYSAIYQEGKTSEYCLSYNQNNEITKVEIGGENSYVMLGHVYFTEDFSKQFIEILKKEYQLEENRKKLWEQIYMEHLDKLILKIKKYPKNIIYEFDSLDELRQFENNFDSNSKILKEISNFFHCKEKELSNFAKKENTETIFSFYFCYRGEKYVYELEKTENKFNIALV